MISSEEPKSLAGFTEMILSITIEIVPQNILKADIMFQTQQYGSKTFPANSSVW